MTKTQLINRDPNKAYRLLVKTQEQDNKVSELINKELLAVKVYTSKANEEALKKALLTLV